MDFPSSRGRERELETVSISNSFRFYHSTSAFYESKFVTFLNEKRKKEGKPRSPRSARVDRSIPFPIPLSNQAESATRPQESAIR